LRKRQTKIRRARASPIYYMGQTVRISKAKMRFAKGFEQNWTLDVFRISMVLRRSLRPVYEFEDPQRRVDRRAVLRRGDYSSQHHDEAEYLVDKILDLLVRPVFEII